MISGELQNADKHIPALHTLSGPADAKEHNDPFDRLLLSRAKVENPAFLTHGELVPAYREKCIIPV